MGLILVLQVRMTFIINIVVLLTIGHIHGSVMEVKISNGIGHIRYNFQMIQELQYNVMWCYSTPKSQ